MTGRLNDAIPPLCGDLNRDTRASLRHLRLLEDPKWEGLWHVRLASVCRGVAIGNSPLFWRADFDGLGRTSWRWGKRPLLLSVGGPA